MYLKIAQYKNMSYFNVDFIQATYFLQNKEVKLLIPRFYQGSVHKNNYLRSQMKTYSRASKLVIKECVKCVFFWSVPERNNMHGYSRVSGAWLRHLVIYILKHYLSGSCKWTYILRWANNRSWIFTSRVIYNLKWFRDHVFFFANGQESFL